MPVVCLVTFLLLLATSPSNCFVKYVTNSDTFTQIITDTKVSIYTDSISLDGNNNCFVDLTKDFQLHAQNATIRGSFAFQGLHDVQIFAVNLLVADNATIDVSGSVGSPDFAGKERATDGMSDGAPGQAGQAAGDGLQGGSITLMASQISGGLLLLKARGGQGGTGQAGGYGHIGAVGQPGECACHDKDPRGKPGGRGGDGGVAGKSGNGGQGGIVRLMYIFNSSLDHVVLDVSGGDPGKVAACGQAGPGGPGGPGGPSSCYNAGHSYDHHWRCHDTPLGPQGPTGSQGNVPSSPSPASGGSPGESEFKEITYDDFGNQTDLAYLHMMLFSADSEYRESDIFQAYSMYSFIMNITKQYAVNNTWEIPQDELYQRQFYFNISNIKILQMKQGLNYQGFTQNWVPLLSYDTVYTTLNEKIIPYLKDVESDHDRFFSDESKQEEKIEIIKSTIQHNQFILSTDQKTIDNNEAEIQGIRDELQDLMLQQNSQMFFCEQSSEICQTAIEEYIAKKEFAIGFKDVFAIAKAAISVFSGAIAGVGDIESFINLFNTAENLFDHSDWAGLGTIMKNFSAIGGKVIDDGASIVTSYEKIKDIVNKPGMEQSAKFAVDGNDFEAVINQWLFLPECYEFKNTYTQYLNISKAINDEVAHHDSLVIKNGELQHEMDQLEKENERLQTKIIREFDPTEAEFVIAVGITLRQLKDRTIDLMNSLQQAFNMEFLVTKKFQYDDTRVSMFEAWLADIEIDRLQMMENMASNKEHFNKDNSVFNAIVLKRSQYPKEFKSLDENGTMTFVLSADEPLFAPLAAIRMASLQIYFPKISSPSGRVRVHSTRVRFSQLIDQSGNIFTYTHASASQLFDYNIYDRSINSQTLENGAFVDLSPLGPWILSLPRSYNPLVDTSKVEEIQLVLHCTFLPCYDPECPVRSYFVPHNVSASSQVNIKNNFTVTVSSNQTETAESNFTAVAFATKSVTVTAHIGLGIQAEGTATVTANATSISLANETVSVSLEGTRVLTETAGAKSTVKIFVGSIPAPGRLAEDIVNNKAQQEAQMIANEEAIAEATERARKKAVTRFQEELDNQASQMAAEKASTLALENAAKTAQQNAEFQAQQLALEEATKRATQVAYENAQTKRFNIILISSLSVGTILAFVGAGIFWLKRRGNRVPLLSDESATGYRAIL